MSRRNRKNALPAGPVPVPVDAVPDADLPDKVDIEQIIAESADPDRFAQALAAEPTTPEVKAFTSSEAAPQIEPVVSLDTKFRVTADCFAGIFGEQVWLSVDQVLDPVSYGAHRIAVLRLQGVPMEPIP